MLGVPVATVANILYALGNVMIFHYIMSKDCTYTDVVYIQAAGMTMTVIMTRSWRGALTPRSGAWPPA